MTKEEAIRIIEANCSCSGSKLREACAMFIPELRESEDERIRKRLLWFLANYTGRWDYPETRMACRAWLEKQKEQKPAWSEGDEKKISELKTFITQCNGFNKANRQKAFNIIDALRPRPHWKPSEEQMRSLRDTIVNTKGYQYSIYLPELYEQLKKL